MSCGPREPLRSLEWGLDQLHSPVPDPLAHTRGAQDPRGPAEADRRVNLTSDLPTPAQFPLPTDSLIPKTSPRTDLRGQAGTSWALGDQSTLDPAIQSNGGDTTQPSRRSQGGTALSARPRLLGRHNPCPGSFQAKGGATAQPRSSQAEGGDCPCPKNSSQKEKPQPCAHRVPSLMDKAHYSQSMETQTCPSCC